MDIILFILVVYIIRSVIKSKKKKEKMKDPYQEKLSYWDQVKKELNLEKKAKEFDRMVSKKMDQKKEVTKKNIKNKRKEKFDESNDLKENVVTSISSYYDAKTDPSNELKVEYLIDFNTDLKKAIIMKEVLDAPKAFEKFDNLSIF